MDTSNFEIWSANGATRCLECGRWDHGGADRIRHASTCDTAQAVKEAAKAAEKAEALAWRARKVEWMNRGLSEKEAERAARRTDSPLSTKAQPAALRVADCTPAQLRRIIADGQIGLFSEEEIAKLVSDGLVSAAEAYTSRDF